jgi:T5orf172 domain
MADMDDDELLDALGVEVTPLKVSSRTPKEERIIAGFEDILRFHQANGRVPLHGEERDIFERLYAVRLDQLRKLPEAQTLLAEMDAAGWLAGGSAICANVDALDEDALLAELGVGDPFDDQDDITVLRHVRSSVEKRAAEAIADRTPCADFDQFQPLFEQAERELKAGVRQALRFGRDASIVCGNYFIVGGVLVYVADVGEMYQISGHDDARLRVIYSNGTESNLLLRSLQKALYKDDTGRRLTDSNMGPLFGDAPEPDDIETGTIYVLRSLSSHPFVAEHRELIHKIGVTGGNVETRIASADKDATYLLADVEVVATYTLHNLNRIKLENIFHRVFGAAQLDLTIADRFGHPVKPREWFLVPLHLIDEAVGRIRDGSITEVVYDPKTARLVKRQEQSETSCFAGRVSQ